MTRLEFTERLRRELRGLPASDIEERIAFYCEMIDDRIEEGRTECEAVAEIGAPEKIAQQILAETPLARIAKERLKPKRSIQPWEIILLVLGSPIWLSLLIAAVSVALSLYAVLWSLVASLWAVFASLAACAPSGVIAGIVFALGGNGASGLLTAGGGLLCAGLAVLAFFGCIYVTRGTALLTKKMALGIKKCFIGRERN